MVARCAKGADEQKYILGAPARLRGRKERDEQDRCSNKKDEISPAIQDPG